MDKNIVISSFYEERFTFLKRHKCKTDTGIENAQIRYLVEGSCTMKINDAKINFNSGDIMYIPQHVPYEIDWVGEKIDFFLLEFNANAFGESYKTVQSLRDNGIMDDFIELENQKENKFKRLEIFYRILGEIAPLLRKDERNENLRKLKNAVAFLNENYTEEIRIDKLAKSCFLSESRFFYLFKKEFGMTPVEYKNCLLIQKAIALLKENCTLEEICEKLNVCSPAYLRKMIKAKTGKTPKEVKKCGEIDLISKNDKNYVLIEN